ncbi:bifunctional phosphopantothenoylcysteine decarboxylase/phosphopantothenate--cysteine ligase CoaBC [Luteimonas vadosa]|uniref:bifunctional phosphopantothenoylcysteine decarboxylase/phosphopantothenate--cysteine ligase CoaBC n=1 Tax=Luteimonas vadosa TaxID=1165507 RepID=UPI003CD0AB3D
MTPSGKLFPRFAVGIFRPVSDAAHKLHGQRILLCVCGGIAAYKAVDLVRRLREAGAEVRVAMTDNAQRFVGAASFQAVSGEPVRSSLWDAAAEAAMGHIELARWADRIVVAPATADTLARLAHGLADDLVSTLCLATTAPITVAPAMNHRMWLHPATQANIALLQSRGVQVVGPADGPLAEGESGPGRLSEPLEIVAALAGTVAPGDFAGLRIVVSAGPTYEDLDPVRYLGNRSSGKMGFAIARAAARRGAEVVLVAGPVALPTPQGVTRVDVRSAAQLHAAVLAALPADAYVGAAAVADFTPRTVAAGKIKKSPEDAESRVLDLVRTDDVLATVARHALRPRLVVGFAAETDDVVGNARRKLEAKGIDLIAANRVGAAGAGFEGDDNELAVLWAGGERRIGPAPKAMVAEALLDVVRERMTA